MDFHTTTYGFHLRVSSSSYSIFVEMTRIEQLVSRHNIQNYGNWNYCPCCFHATCQTDVNYSSLSGPMQNISFDLYYHSKMFFVATNYHWSYMQITLSLGSNNINWQTIKQKKPHFDYPKKDHGNQMQLKWQPAIPDADVKNDKWGLSRIFSTESPGIYCVPTSLGQVHSKGTSTPVKSWVILNYTITFTTFKSNFLFIKTSSFWKQVKIVITADINTTFTFGNSSWSPESIDFWNQTDFFSNPLSPWFTRFVTLVNSLTSLIFFIYRREITNLTGLISGTNKITCGKSGTS